MSDSEYGGRRRKKSNRAAGCAGCGCGILILLAMAIVILYVNRNRPPDIVVPPPPTPPANNAYDDFVQAGVMAKNMTHPGPSSLGGTAANNPLLTQSGSLSYQAAMAEEAAPMLNLLHKALDKPYLTPITYSYNAIFPEYAQFRNVARTTNDVAAYYERKGQRDKALDTLLDGYEMGVTMPKGGVLITGLVGIAIQAINVRSLDAMLLKLNSSQLAHAAQRLDRIAAKQVPYGDVLATENDFMTAGFIETMRHSKGGFSDFRAMSGGFDDGSGNGNSHASFDQWVQGARYAFGDKTAMLRENRAYLQTVIAETRKPYVGPSHIPLPNNILAQIMMPVFDQAQVKFVSMEAVNALLRVETALYRYQAAKGQFPLALNILSTERAPDGKPFLTVALDDLFGGKPLRYAPAEDGKTFFLYSIGPDMKDDNGLPTKSPGENGGDIVAGKMFAPKFRMKPNAPALTSGRPSSERDRRHK